MTERSGENSHESSRNQREKAANQSLPKNKTATEAV
jgi:hypothetical protein